MSDRKNYRILDDTELAALYKAVDDGVGRLLQNQEARDAVRNEESSETPTDGDD